MPRSPGHAPSGGVVDATSSGESTVPAWLAARRARVSTTVEPEPELDVEFAAVPEVDCREEPDAVAAELPVASVPVTSTPEGPEPQGPDPFVAPVPKVNRSKPAAVILPPAANKVDQPLVSVHAEDAVLPEDNSFKGRLLRWLRSSAMAGILVSLLVHTVILSVLAILVIGGTSLRPGLELFGVMADPNVPVADLVLDSAMPVDPGKEAAPLEFPDMTKLISTEKAEFNPSTSLNGAVGGTGSESGEGGEGRGMSVPALNIPKYAVTKGSFSAWTDPKDPEPGFSYQIVIQFRLPANVKTYRGSDLTGMVIGTDGYKQAIRLSKNETFKVQDGSVQIRQVVPGAAKLVRDTIRVESKLLREKQVLEIEF
ncbi:MAG: hypothetical protein JSS49_10915 [Planctomycetes bacterium]|nr:hypothetical protein [Planctomycetota bacterium]